MADPKELELKLKATGGDAAAAEVEKLEDAVESLDKSSSSTTAASDALGDAQAEMGNRFDEARARVAALKNATDSLNGTSGGGGLKALFPTFTRAGQGISALGSKMVSMAGGPIGILTAAVVGLISVWKNHEAAVKEVTDSLDETRDGLNDIIAAATDTGAAMDTAATSARSYKDELTAMNAETEAALDAWEEAERRVLALADAQDALKKANIDARVAAGEITSEEGDAMKGEIDIDAVKAKADAELKLAEGRKAVADVEAKRAADAEQKATEDAAAAQEALAAEKAKAATAAAAIATKALKGDIVANGSSADAVNVMGDQESRDRLGEMGGAAGFIARTRLNMGEGPETIMGMGERAAIAKQIADEAKAEADALAESSKDSIAAAEAVVSERQKQLEAVKAVREKAEADAKKSGDEVDKAGFEKALTTDFEVPAMETRNNTTRAKGEERAAKQKADDEARAAKEEARQAQLAESGAISGDLSRLGRNGAASGFDPAAVKALDSAAAKLANGTDFSELTSVIGSLTTAADQLDAKNQAAINAALAPVKIQIANLLSRLNNQR